MGNDTGVDAQITIVGGGLAGLFCALKLAPRPVRILTAASLGAGASTAWAQGGIAAALGEGDSPASHYQDTLSAGCGIVDQNIARLITNEARSRIDDLIALGVPLDRDDDGSFRFSLEAAHSHRRVLRVKGDMAGQSFMEALIRQVLGSDHISIVPNIVVSGLVVKDKIVTGVTGYDTDGAFRQFSSDFTVIATGGSGHLYRRTTNPSQALGTAVAMAAEAGALLADLEFIQFHPTALAVDQDPVPLLTEALRGEGGMLVNGDGRRFMFDYHPNGELAPRDIVARAVYHENLEGRGAYLDCRVSTKNFAQNFPRVYQACSAHGLNPQSEILPVTEAAHYHMGGIWTDEHGKSSLTGLWVCGEAASTGFHGANRLASNSLLEAVVMAQRVADNISGTEGHKGVKLNGEAVKEAPAWESENTQRLVLELRELMMRHVGVVRDAKGMTHALDKLNELGRKDHSRKMQLVNTVARLITFAALERKESRGGHFRSDFPERSPDWERRSYLSFDKSNCICKSIEMQKLR